MTSLFLSSLITLICLIVNICRDDKRSPFQYFLLFFTCLGMCYFFRISYCEASPSFPLTERMLDICSKKDEAVIKVHHRTISEEDIKRDFIAMCQEKLNYHHDEGVKCFQDAEASCMWFPCIDDRELAQRCFLNIIAAANPGTPKSRLISSLITAIGQYGSLVIIEWQRIDTKLQQAKTHFELEEFYLEVGRHVEREMQFRRTLKTKRKDEK